MELPTPVHLGVVAIEKEDLGSPSTQVANNTYFTVDEVFNSKLIRPWIIILRHNSLQSGYNRLNQFMQIFKQIIKYLYIYIERERHVGFGIIQIENI